MKKIKINQLSIILIILLIFSSSAFALDTLKIMPLGNSITRGSTGSYNSAGTLIQVGYRGRLDTLLYPFGHRVNSDSSKPFCANDAFSYNRSGHGTHYD